MVMQPLFLHHRCICLVISVDFPAPLYPPGPDEETEQGVFLDHNSSQRYESRFVTVRVGASPALMMRGMEGTVFGMWVSHGEGEAQWGRP